MRQLPLLQISKVAKKVYAEHGRAEAIAAVALVDKALSPARLRH
jgi:hypothetical protein